MVDSTFKCNHPYKKRLLGKRMSRSLFYNVIMIQSQQTKQYGTGEDWYKNGEAVRIAYLTNQADNKCREAYDGRTMENTYVYDSRSRLLSVSASLNGNAPVSLIRNEYDEGCHKQCLRFYKRCKHHQ